MPEVTVLECASPYRTNRVEYAPGQVLHLPIAEAAHLLRDSRESFRVLATTAEGLEQDGSPVKPQTTEEIGKANWGTGEGPEPAATEDPDAITDPPAGDEENVVTADDSPDEAAAKEAKAGEPEEVADDDPEETADEVAGDHAASIHSSSTATAAPEAEEKSGPKSRKSRPRRASSN